MNILQTKDYDRFSFIPFNRKIREDHVRRLEKSIESGNLEIPIVVNEKGQIIDGQHRFKALQKLGKPILYIEKKGFGIKQVKTLNSQQKNWTLKDFILSIADEGNVHYQKLIEFKEMQGFSWTLCILMMSGKPVGCGGGRNACDSTSVVREGGFKVRSWDHAVAQAEMVKLILRQIPFMDTTRHIFTIIKAILQCSVVEGFEVNRFVEKLEISQNKTDISKMGKIEDVVSEFERIYNYHSQKKTTIPLKHRWGLIFGN